LGPFARRICEYSTVEEYQRAVLENPRVDRRRTHPGVGPLTALAFVLIIGNGERFRFGKQSASYLGLAPSEDSGGDRRRLGHISKQGNALLRILLVEAAQVTASSTPEWRGKYFHLACDAGENCESSDGLQTGHSAVLDAVQRMGLRASEKIQPARGTARKSPWCAVKQRVIYWASRSSSTDEFQT
jgi:hypothetical protein